MCTSLREALKSGDNENVTPVWQIETIDGRRQTCILTHNCDGERQRCSPQTILVNIYFNVNITLLSECISVFYFFLPSLVLRVFRPQYCPIPQSALFVTGC